MWADICVCKLICGQMWAEKEYDNLKRRNGCKGPFKLRAATNPHINSCHSSWTTTLTWLIPLAYYMTQTHNWLWHIASKQ